MSRSARGALSTRQRELARGPGIGRLIGRVALDRIDPDVAAVAEEVVEQRAVDEVPPARVRGLSDDDLRDVLLAGEAQDLGRHVLALQADGGAAETLGEREVFVHARALLRSERSEQGRLDERRVPRRA